MKALLKIKLFRIDLNIVFCKESKITLGIGILTSVVSVSVVDFQSILVVQQKTHMDLGNR